jgi:hypothetical protein
MRWACHVLSQLAAHDDSKVLMTRAGAHEALLDVEERALLEHAAEQSLRQPQVAASAADASPAPLAVGFATMSISPQPVALSAASAESGTTTSAAIAVCDYARVFETE